MMIDPSICVTDLAMEIKYYLGCDMAVFKYDDKPSDFKGEYVAVNNLPFKYGRAVNDDNIINVNVHVPRTELLRANRPRLDELKSIVAELIPFQSYTEDSATLFLNGVHYCIDSMSQPIEDKDETYFVNIRVKVIFSNL